MKKSGFTLIEILAVIVVLGLVAGIVIPAVDRFIKNSVAKAYDVQIEAIIDGVRNWEVDHPFSLPVNDGDEYTMTLDELKNGNYLKQDIINPKTDELFPNTTTITIKKVNGTHVYTVNVQ